MKKRGKWILGGLVLALVLMQFIHPVRLNPPAVGGRDLMAANPPPPKVAALLRAACYDCHSDEIKWPWYSHVAPVSWWLVGHINEAHEKLNFSKWPHDEPLRTKKKWRNISEQVSSREMPLPSYTWMHPAARLSAADRQLLVQWADQETERLKALVPAEEPAK